ncbi:MAG: hypothetical protein KAG98_03700 [Lentisphaeria bacterium]|nr:hypothetical protein [Lentisphaeria bacterium]
MKALLRKTLLLSTLLIGISTTYASHLPDDFSWDRQSKNSGESMPLGGGDTGLNVWVENGDLLFYISRSGVYDENNRLNKMGRVRVTFSPNILADKDCQFTQVLKLKDGYIEVTGVKGNDKVSIKLWVDVFKPVINLEATTTLPTKMTASYENWRTEDKNLPDQLRHACFGLTGYPDKVFDFKDETTFIKNTVLSYHRNRDEYLVIDKCLDQQGLKKRKTQIPNPQKNLTCGILMKGKQMVAAKEITGKYINTPFKAWPLVSKVPTKSHELTILSNISQTPTVKQWKLDLLKLDKYQQKHSSHSKTIAWWNEFWQRSWINITGDKKGAELSRNYELFRYMLGCNAYGKYPTKFNGGLFTVDPVLTNRSVKGSPDYRAWGGGSFTAQNQRLVYWPMLKSGDFDAMTTQFDFYLNGLKAAEVRTKEYWGHAGCSFTEHSETFGLPAAATWGFTRGKGGRKRSDKIPYGELANQWVRLHYTNQLEFSFMILEYYRYSGRDISKYLPFIESSLTFFVEHYKYRQRKRNGKSYDENGKLVFFPSTACETFKNVKNPTDLSVAMTSVIHSLETLPNSLLSKAKKKHWHSYLARIPEINYVTDKGKKRISAAVKYGRSINTDIPELYPVYPYGIYGIGRPDLQTAINTWRSPVLNGRKNHISWHQDAIFCARLGLTSEAKSISIRKLQNSGRKFPAFWGPGHDWVPDHNWGGSGMIGLQEMVMQAVDKKIYLLPAWPKDWDANIKLNAPGNTTIQATIKAGKVTKLIVTPKARRKDVIVLDKATSK